MSDDEHFRIRPRLRDLSNRSSVAEIVEYRDEITGEMKRKIRMTMKKFTPEAQLVFLEEYKKWGRMGESAYAAGVSTQTVRKHLEEDEDFIEAFIEAEQTYKEKLIGHHQDLIFNGIEKVQFDRNGNVISRTTEYPIRLIELELKKHDEGYRDKREVKMDVTGGVLVAPAEVPSIEDWEKKYIPEMRDVTPYDDEEDTDGD